MTQLNQEQLDEMSKAREQRCRPVVNAMLEAMIKEEVLMADIEYIEAVINQEIESMFKVVVLQHKQTILSDLNNIMVTSLRYFEKARFGKDPENLTVKDIDQGVKDYVKANKKK